MSLNNYFIKKNGYINDPNILALCLLFHIPNNTHLIINNPTVSLQPTVVLVLMTYLEYDPYG